MPTILAIETATDRCSVALFEHDQLTAHKVATGRNHAEVLPVFVEDIIRGKQLSAVALSAGPGSYTGLRIGTATAKGLCYGFSVPLIAVDTLTVIAARMAQVMPKGMLCPMIDARRQEVYCSMFNAEDLQQLSPVEAKIIDENSFADVLENEKLYIGGDGAQKCMSLIKSPNLCLLDNTEPDAAVLAQLAAKEYAQHHFADLAYFEPNYLKQYVAIKSVNKVLR